MASIRKRTWGVVIAIGLATLVVTPVHGLDKYQDRSGLYWGMGLGGGGAVRVPSGNVGGEGIFDLQLGAGANHQLTISLDTDISVLGFENEIDLSIVPGPEVAYFFGKTGLFIRGGVGAAMSVVRVNDSSDFIIGFDVDVGFGWEFFVSSDLAVSLALESGYTVQKGDDNVLFGFMMGFKVY